MIKNSKKIGIKWSELWKVQLFKKIKAERYLGKVTVYEFRKKN